MKKEGVSAPRALSQAILTKALKRAGTMNALSKDLQIRVGTVCSWYKGSQPREDHLLALEAYLAKAKPARRAADGAG